MGLALTLNTEEREWGFDKKGKFFWGNNGLGAELGNGCGWGFEGRRDWKEREREKVRVFSMLCGAGFASELGDLGFNLGF